MARALRSSQVHSIDSEIERLSLECRRHFVEGLPALLRIVSNPDEKAVDVIRALSMLAQFAGLEKRFGEIVDHAFESALDVSKLTGAELNELASLLDKIGFVTSQIMAEHCDVFGVGSHRLEKVRSLANRRVDIGHSCAQSFSEYVQRTSHVELHSWQRLLCDRLQALKSQVGQRLLIHAPPQFGKSLIVTKRFPAWWLGHNRFSRVVVGAYAESHALGLIESARHATQDSAHQLAFPGFHWGRWSADAGGFTTERLEVGDGQPSLRGVGLLSGFTGIGVDLLIVDDPYGSPDDARSSRVNDRVWRWWSELARVRLNEQTNVVVMFHRYHEDDIAGRLMAEGCWETIRFPALADENTDGCDPTDRELGEPLSPLRARFYLEQLRDSDPFTFASQFQGVPIPDSGGFCRESDFADGVTIPRLRQWVRYFDLAVSSRQTGDFTAGALLGVAGDQSLHLRHMVRFRKEWPDAKEEIIKMMISDAALCEAEGASYRVGVDARLTQQALYHDLTRDKRIASHPILCHAVFPDRSVGDKKERATAWVARARAGQLTIYRTGWDVSALISEARVFTGDGRDSHDDQIDAISGAYSLLNLLPDSSTYVAPKWQSMVSIRDEEKKR